MVEKSNSILFGPLPPTYGGVSVFVEGLSESVIERGGKVWTYTGGRERYPDNPLYVGHRKLGHIAAALREARKGRITDSTHFHVEYPNPMLLPMWLLIKRILGFHWVKVIHDGSLPSRYENFSSTQKRLFRAAIRNIDEFVASSEELASWLTDVQVTPSRVSVIPTLLPRKASSSGVSIELSERLEKPAEHKRQICSIGIFIPSYGFQQIADAVERERAELNEDIGLLLVDGTFARDDEYRSKVLNGRDWITVIENVPNPDIPQLLSGCDAFVRATEHEGFGISRVEALWSEVPVIATNVGETRGMLIYEFGDVDRLCQHIRSVLRGGSAPDAQESAQTMRHEAQQNLDKYLQVIMGE